MSTIYTIGSGGKSAEKFFTLLQENGVKTLVDIRLNNTSQLAGFTKKDSLEYFLDKICQIKYIHKIDLAPTDSILKNYQKKLINWSQYETAYNDLLQKRLQTLHLDSTDWDKSCLLCSEKTPEFCHRRLAAEFLKNQGLVQEIKHLV